MEARPDGARPPAAAPRPVSRRDRSRISPATSSPPAGSSPSASARSPIVADGSASTTTSRPRSPATASANVPRPSVHAHRNRLDRHRFANLGRRSTARPLLQSDDRLVGAATERQADEVECRAAVAAPGTPPPRACSLSTPRSAEGRGCAAVGR